MVGLVLAGALGLGGETACGDTDESAAKTAPQQAAGPGTAPEAGAAAGWVLPAGGGLPEAVEEMLTGSARACRHDAECATRVCYYGTCMGALLIDQRWRQQRATAPLVRAARRDDALRARLVDRLREVFHRPDTDLAYRARALLVLEALGARGPLVAALDDPNEALQAVAALSLTRMGDARGLPLARALAESDARPVAVEALHALGASGAKEVLPDLLAWLNGDLDRERVRAAVVALKTLGDARAVGPLVRFVAEGPAYLRARVAMDLRALTGARLGTSPEAWAAWARDNPPPPPPPFRLHQPDAAAEFGLPEP